LRKNDRPPLACFSFLFYLTDFNGFISTRLAGNDTDPRFGHVKIIGENFNHRVIGFAFVRRSGYLDAKMRIIEFRDFIARGFWGNFDVYKHNLIRIITKTAESQGGIASELLLEGRGGSNLW